MKKILIEGLKKALDNIEIAEIVRNVMYTTQKYYDNSAKSLRRLAFKVKMYKYILQQQV